MKHEAHGTQQPRHTDKIGEAASTAQRSDSLVQSINQRFLKLMHWELPVHIVRWQDEADKLRFIRTVVFIQEQQVPVELEWDEFDAVGIHALALNSEGQPIGTARLLPDGHIGRMAVLKQWRGMGVGRAILQAILHELIQRRASKAILNAQISAIGFYEKFGFRPEGAVFLEANIPHIKMILSLENI